MTTNAQHTPDRECDACLGTGVISTRWPNGRCDACGGEGWRALTDAEIAQSEELDRQADVYFAKATGEPK